MSNKLWAIAGHLMKAAAYGLANGGNEEAETEHRRKPRRRRKAQAKPGQCCIAKRGEVPPVQGEES